MIKDFVRVLESLDKRLEVIEDVLPTLASKINDIASIVGEPSGYVTLAGKINTDLNQVKNDVGVRMQLESVMLDAQFSNAVFMGARLKDNPEIESTLTEAAVKQLKSTLLYAQRLESLVDHCDARLLDIEVATAKAKDNLSLNVQKMIEDKFHKVEESVDKKVSEMQATNEKLEDGIKRLESASAKAEALSSRLDNKVTVKTKPSSFVSRKV